MASREELITRIGEYLDQEDLNHYYNNDDHGTDAFVMFTGCPSRIGTLSIKIYPLDEELIFAAVSPVKVDACDVDTMRKVSEYLHRATYGMKIGAFDLDFNDGEAQFRASIPVKEAVPNDDTLGMLVAIGPSMWARYGDGFFNVAFLGAEPEKEVADAEGASEHLAELLRRIRAAQSAEDDDAEGHGIGVMEC